MNTDLFDSLISTNIRRSVIVAMDRQGLIGTKTGLPWHLRADLRRFRACTMGKPIIMGRLTWDLIGKPLPGRFNIIVSQNATDHIPDCRVVGNLNCAITSALNYVKEQKLDEFFFIGGSQIYQQALPMTDRIYLTVVEGDFTGSVWFPLDSPDRWQLRKHQFFSSQ